MEESNVYKSLSRKTVFPKNIQEDIYTGRTVGEMVEQLRERSKMREKLDTAEEETFQIRNPKPDPLYSKDIFSSSSKVLSKHLKLNLKVDLSIDEIFKALTNQRIVYSEDIKFLEVSTRTMQNLYVYALKKKFQGLNEDYCKQIFRYETVQGKKMKFGYTNTDWALLRTATLESSAKIDFRGLEIKNLKTEVNDNVTIGQNKSLGGFDFDLYEEFTGDKLAWVKSSRPIDPTQLNKKKIGWGQNIIDFTLLDQHRVDIYEVYTKEKRGEVKKNEIVSLIFPISIKFENCFENSIIIKNLEETIFDNFNLFLPVYQTVLKGVQTQNLPLIKKLVEVKDNKEMKVLNKAQSLYLEYKSSLVSLCREIKSLYEKFSFSGLNKLVKKILGIKDIKKEYIQTRVRIRERTETQDADYRNVMAPKEMMKISDYVNKTNFEIVKSKITLGDNNIVEAIKFGDDIEFKSYDTGDIKTLINSLLNIMKKVNVLDNGEVYMSYEVAVNNIAQQIEEIREDENVDKVKEYAIELGSVAINNYLEVRNGIDTIWEGISGPDAIEHGFVTENEVYELLKTVLSNLNMKIGNTWDDSCRKAFKNTGKNEIVADLVPEYFIDLYLKLEKEKNPNNSSMAVQVNDGAIQYNLNEINDFSELKDLFISDFNTVYNNNLQARFKAIWGAHNLRIEFLKNVRILFGKFLRVADEFDRAFSGRAALTNEKIGEFDEMLLEVKKNNVFTNIFEKFKSLMTNPNTLPGIFNSGQSIDSMKTKIGLNELKLIQYLYTLAPPEKNQIDDSNRIAMKLVKQLKPNYLAEGIDYRTFRELGKSDELDRKNYTDYVNNLRSAVNKVEVRSEISSNLNLNEESTLVSGVDKKKKSTKKVSFLTNAKSRSGMSVEKDENEVERGRKRIFDIKKDFSGANRNKSLLGEIRKKNNINED